MSNKNVEKLKEMKSFLYLVSKEDFLIVCGLNPINIFLCPLDIVCWNPTKSLGRRISRPSRLTSWLVDWAVSPVLSGRWRRMIIIFFRALSGSYSPAPLTGRFFSCRIGEKKLSSFFFIKSQFVAALEFRHKCRHSLDRQTLLGRKLS